MTADAVRPILVVMVWRGGRRFARCLDSIDEAQRHFSRIVLSVTAAEDSDDMRMARDFAEQHAGVEVICTGVELPTMQHQAFWIDHLQRTGARDEDWIYWLAYDDQVRTRGIEALVDGRGDWPLRRGTAYFGPWDTPLESWTSFPLGGPTRLPVLDWIGQQLRQPTYMQMSGSVCPFESFVRLRDSRPRKGGPMRIEMAIAAAPPTTHVQEFAEPVSIIYGRSNSDRANYGTAARKEDVHLAAWLAQYVRRHPREAGRLVSAAAGVTGTYVRAVAGRTGLPAEQWVVRGEVLP